MKRHILIICIILSFHHIGFCQGGTSAIDTLTVNLSHQNAPHQGRSTVKRQIDSLQTQLDTIQQSINALLEISQNTEEIAHNTEEDSIKDGWNVYGWIAFLIAAFTLLYAIRTFRAQNATERHTQKAPKDAQLGVLKDLPRHFYRNLACTCASLLKFRTQTLSKFGGRLCYPSEANILKLTTLPDEFILPIDSSSDLEYQKMHEEKLLFKNYNLEIEVAAKHFATKGLSDDSLKNDYDNLLFKPLFLTTRMFELQDMITSDSRNAYVNNVVYALYAFAKEHFEKIDINAFVNDKHNEIDYLNTITDDSVFVNSIGVNDDSIARSLKMLLKYKKNDENEIAFLKRERDKTNNDNEFDGKGIITKSIFKDYFEKTYKNEAIDGKTRGLDNFLKILRIHNEDVFVNEFNSDLKTANASTAYNALRFYFDFLSKDEWDVKGFLFTILKVDAVLEIGKVGMIEY